MKRPDVFHVYNGKGGGVLSVIQNLIRYSGGKCVHHVIHTVSEAELLPGVRSAIAGAASQQYFTYSPGWNFYHTAEKLSMLLPGKEALIVAHDWLELGMMSNLGLQNPCVLVLHGNYEYYYELAQKHDESIDHFICVSPVIRNELSKRLPSRKATIHYNRFPVPRIDHSSHDNKILRMFYCVRDLNDINKQYHMLPAINRHLKGLGIQVQWTIIGKGRSSETIKDDMSGCQVDYFPFVANDELTAMLGAHDIFLLPSLKEGFPVAVVEAMKAGLVPIVTDWDGATAELIEHGVTGYYVETGNVEGYVKYISDLHANRQLLKQLSRSSMSRANELFDPVENANAYEEVFIEATRVKVNKKRYKVYGSRLDQPWIPNFFVSMIRNKGNANIIN